MTAPYFSFKLNIDNNLDEDDDINIKGENLFNLEYKF